MSIYYPKKSHHGYYDDSLKVRFESKKHKEEHLKKYGFYEAEPATKAHIKRVRDFIGWVHDEKRKNPDFEKTKEFKREKYPD